MRPSAIATLLLAMGSLAKGLAVGAETSCTVSFAMVYLGFGRNHPVSLFVQR